MRFHFVLGMLLIVPLLTGLVHACGPDWFPPDEVERGFYSQTLSTITVGKETIPVLIVFRPGLMTHSQLLGPAWYVPLMESFIEEHKDKIIVHAPDASDQEFAPAPQAPDVYVNQNGWAGEKKEDSFVIHSGCGWRITYKRGKIVELKTKENLILQWTYQKEQPLTITGPQGALLTLRLSSPGRAEEVTLPSEQISFTYDKFSGLYNGASLLSGTVWKNGAEEKYSYRAKLSDQALLFITLRSGDKLSRLWDTNSNRLITEEFSE
jgi:hypothetical protein